MLSDFYGCCGVTLLFLWVVGVCICVKQRLFTGWVGWLVYSLLQMLFVGLLCWLYIVAWWHCCWWLWVTRVGLWYALWQCCNGLDFCCCWFGWLCSLCLRLVCWLVLVVLWSYRFCYLGWVGGLGGLLWGGCIWRLTFNCGVDGWNLESGWVEIWSLGGLKFGCLGGSEFEVWGSFFRPPRGLKFGSGEWLWWAVFVGSGLFWWARQASFGCLWLWWVIFGVV